MSETKAETPHSASGAGDALQELEWKRIIGFNGDVRNGLIVHVDRKRLIYPAGRNIVVEDISAGKPGKQKVLSRHTGFVTCLALSNCGQYLVSGQETVVGAKAPTILWDLNTGAVLLEQALHKVAVEAVCFSMTRKYFITLGSPDDRNIVVWETYKCKPVVQKDVSSRRAGTMHCVASSRVDDYVFVTAGDNYGRIWRVDPVDNTLSYKELQFGTGCQRTVVCMDVADCDNLELPMLFCGTKTGDVIVFNMKTGLLQGMVPKKAMPQGVTTITYLQMAGPNTFVLLIGTGEGVVGKYCLTIRYSPTKKIELKFCHVADSQPWRDNSVISAVTSISKIGAGHTVYVGTKDCQIYRLQVVPMTAERVLSSSNQPVEAICFARDTDELLVVGGLSSVRVFNLRVMKEVRRYVRQNFTCKTLALRHDGTLIFSGWNDGLVKVLGFDALNLEIIEKYQIQCAQKQPVTALALTSISDVLATGGRDAQVRVWRLVEDYGIRGKQTRQALLVHVLCDQGGSITMLNVSQDDKFVLSSSEDGRVILYSIETGHRKFSAKLHCIVLGANLAKDDLLVLSCGGDGNVHYWEVVTNELIRQVQGASSGPVTSLNVDRKSKYIVTVADDNMVKLWNFDSAEVTHVGVAHCETPNRVLISPCRSLIVSAATDGTIIIWNMPKCGCDD